MFEFWILLIVAWSVVCIMIGADAAKTGNWGDFRKALFGLLLITTGPLAFIAALCYGVGKSQNNR